MESYEQLLEEAYQQVKPVRECGRFEIKKVEGRVQGNKTFVSNFGEIARCIRREKIHLAKFLFGELASSGDVGERLVFDRKVSSKDINNKIEKYVNKYVKCTNCGKPDTELVEDKGIYVRCLACGVKKQVA